MNWSFEVGNLGAMMREPYQATFMTMGEGQSTGSVSRRGISVFQNRVRETIRESTKGNLFSNMAVLEQGLQVGIRDRAI
ncbi:hypothetical protein VN97_g10790 [Penicillium thymicola]|uniref:Uncharacterized protein n=1 Tax=Penicillium thymicola TaxID=293382 RepID=A0AAI9T8H4_PENTH|nr:hypothetical protein VN97_g10790 [Penicillium thymicola]